MDQLRVSVRRVDPIVFGRIEEHTAEERVEDVHCSITCGEEDDLRGEKWKLGGSYSPES